MLQTFSEFIALSTDQLILYFLVKKCISGSFWFAYFECNFI